ncbi:hypothetical protein MNBD_GAMMA05-1079 [hydrothermal vent metagenome]|uniref:Ribosome small subunit-stimulated GTPase EngC n=1 Tax=hydrothermal vent metagenome TaxID=652676 RepID=A0A3B0WMC2_9ZZZZ
MKNLKSIGFNDWVKSHSKTDMLENHHIVRIVSVHKESYIVSNGEDDIFAELSGKLMYSTDSTLDLPTTGDWVYVDIYDNNTHEVPMQ